MGATTTYVVSMHWRALAYMEVMSADFYEHLRMRKSRTMAPIGQGMGGHTPLTFILRVIIINDTPPPPPPPPPPRRPFSGSVGLPETRYFFVVARVHKNGHNSACDQYFFMKLAPLDSAHIELSVHAKNSNFIKYPEWSLSQQVTYLTHKFTKVWHITTRLYL